MSITVITPSGSITNSPSTYSSNVKNMFIRGMIALTDDENSFSISLEGTTYTGSDIYFDAENNFIFPNPSVNPDGLQLLNGTSSFILKLGANENFYLDIIVPSESIYLAPESPKGLSIERLAQDVVIKFPHTDSTISYYNVYASTTTGGGTFGYRKLNFEPLDPISYGNPKEKVSELTSTTFDTTTKVADPLYTVVNLIQKNQNNTVLSTDPMLTQEIPENIQKLRVVSSISAIELATDIVFKHNRQATENSTPPTIQIGAFASMSSENVLYYVATAVKIVDGVEIESAYSTEVGGKPINLSQSNASLPVISRQVLTNEMISNIYKTQPNILVNPGSVTRDVVIDPFVSEMERARFLLDFTYRASSFTTLLQIDDPRNTGTSVLVSQSSYKQALAQALFLGETNRVQYIIDSAFEKLASNFGIRRRIGTRSIGQVVFFTRNVPTRSINIQIGTRVSSTSGLSFRTTQFASIPQENNSSYYDPIKKRWAVYVPVESDEIGISSNLTTGQLRTTGIYGLSVDNESPLFGGTDPETNLELSARALNALSSTDTGTKNGYERLANSVAGVSEAIVISAEDPYMYRGDGKVDVWTRGESLGNATDIFSPDYQIHRDSLFIPIGEGTYVFKLEQMGVSLFKMLDYPTLGYGLKNATTDEFFDLTGASITNNVLTLDMDIQTITYSITDKIIGDWQEPLSTKIYMTRQPVNSITSIITEDGTILENGVDYQFIKAEDPLLYGYSTKAKDYVIIENTTTFENFRVGTEESISFIGFYPYQLAKKGIDPFSIYVADFLTSEGIEPTIYRSSYENDPDYFIEVNNDGTISLTAIAGGRLNDNKVLLIEYTYNTNITITYQFNQIPINVQNQIDQFKHLTADVLVKDCIPVPVDMRAKVIINKGYRPAQIDVLIRTNIQNYITSLGLGSNLRVSDIVRTMSDVSGVAYIDLPFYQFAISENTAIIRESIVVGNNYTPISLLNSGVAFAWLIDVNLKHTAIDGGGSLGKVYANDVEMTLIPPNNRLNLTDKPFQVTIIGNSNLVIGGNPILNSANKILVSLAIGQSPSDYNFVVNYVTTTGTNVVHNISLPPFSYFKVGTLSFTYEEEI